MAIKTIRHLIAATFDFNGVSPANPGEIDLEKELTTHAESGGGGRFSFDVRRRHRLRRVLLDVTTASTWTLSLLSRGVSVELFSNATNPGNTVLISGEELALLDRGDELVLVTTGATDALSAEVTVEEF